MLTGVLVVAHGSRASETEADLDFVLETVKTKLKKSIVECAFMEFSDRTIEKGVLALVNKGVTDILVVPYFLFMGIHLKEDIPAIIEQVAAKYPNVTISVSPHLGTDERLADIVVDRILLHQSEGMH